MNAFCRHMPGICKILLTISIGLSLFLALPQALRAKERPRVLFISSYHPGYPTFYSQVRGMNSLFLHQDMVFDVEFMDTKRFPQSENRTMFRKSLHWKLSKLKAYDIVIAADENAFSFVLEEQDGLFRNIPLIFLGVNNVESAIAQDENPRITGVVETVSMKETIEAMIKLCPAAQRIIAIVDDTRTGKQDLEGFQKAAKGFESHEFVVQSLVDMDWSQFCQCLEKYGSTDAVLLISAFREGKHTARDFDDVVDAIAKHCSSPVFHLWEHGIGRGLIGGKIVSHFEQGRAAAKMAIDILSGKNVADIKVLRESPNKFVFDYVALKKHGISLHLLPEGSILLNEPSSVFRQYRKPILVVAVIILLLLAALFFSLRNIHERRKAESVLKKQKNFLRTVIETIPELVWLKSCDGKYLMCNPRFERFFGAPEAEIVGKTDFDFVDEELATFFRQKDVEAMEAQKPQVNEETVTYADDGHEEVLETIKTPVVNDEGIIEGILGISRDITLRKAAKQKIFKEKQKYETILKTASDGFIIAEVSRKIIEVNDAYTKMSGYSADELVTMSIDDIEAAMDSQQIDAIIEEGFHSGFKQFQTRHRRKDGSVFEVEISSNFATFEDKKIVIFVKDISEKKELERRLFHIQKMESIGELAGGIAHDFNNILAPIVGMSELLLDDLQEGTEAASNAAEILMAGRRGGELVKQILAFSRQTEHEKEPMQLQQIVEEVLLLVRATIPADIEISQNIDSECGLVLADPTEMHQVILNLMTNAYHAVEGNGGCISISLNEVDPLESASGNDAVRSKRCVRLTVSDTGIGMSDELCQKVFEPYFTTKEQGKGTGLGLSVVYGIVKASGGEITVESTPGEGTAFHLFFPLLAEPAMAQGLPAHLKPPAGKERILVVDDEKAVAKLEEQMLKRLGYTVTVFTDCTMALEHFRAFSDQFDLVLSDMTMPDMTGDRLAEQLIEIRKDIPIIICTGYSARIDEDRAFEIGVKGFLMKPISKSDLACAIRDVLDGSSS